MLPQYKPNIIPIRLVILKESLLQIEINDVLDKIFFAAIYSQYGAVMKAYDRDIFFSITGILNGYVLCQNSIQKCKGLNLGAKPLRIKLCKDHPLPPGAIFTKRKRMTKF